MEERRIATVMTFPELYNPAMKEYKDVNRRAAACRCIALQFGISGPGLPAARLANDDHKNNGDFPGPMMPFECPRTPTPVPSWPLQSPCPATPERLQSPSNPLHGRSRPSRPRRGHTELSEFEAQVMKGLSSRPDEEKHFGLSLAATLRRLPP